MTAIVTPAFGRYLLVGLLATAVHYALLVALVEFAGAAAAPSAAFGAACGALAAYAGNRRFTFPGAPRHGQALPRFLAVAALGAATNGAIVWTGTAGPRHALPGGAGHRDVDRGVGRLRPEPPLELRVSAVFSTPKAAARAGAACTLSVVVPVCNEEAVLAEFHRRLVAAIEDTPGGFEVIYVDDGSIDGTPLILRQLRALDARIGTVRLSRNFGKEQAMSAGLREARGAATVVIDADLQDPPELIPAMLDEWRRGADVVNMRRRHRAGENWLKRATAYGFYRVMNRLSDVPIPVDTGDFRLLSRRALDALNSLPERNRVMKGLFAWIGFRQRSIDYDRDARVAGSSKWRYWKLWNLALEGITGFSDRAAQGRDLRRLPDGAVGVRLRRVRAGEDAPSRRPGAGFPDADRRDLVPRRTAADGDRRARRVRRAPLRRGQEPSALPRRGNAFSRAGAADPLEPRRCRIHCPRIPGSSDNRLLWIAIAAAFAARFLLLGAFPLMDPTESRYAEIARQMFVLGDWVTPWIAPGEPFWGKPPLSFWMTAGSFQLFGVSDFAARLPHWVGGGLVAWLVWNWLALRSRREAALAVALLAGSLLFFVSAGAVMTDMALAIGLMAVMRGFWLALHGPPEHRGREQFLMFAGFAVGLLAKGPDRADGRRARSRSGP